MTVKKKRVSKITFERVEGYSDGRDGTGVVHEVATFAEVDAIIAKMRAGLEPDARGYYKCDFVVTWEDGETYDGRYDLGHGTDDATLGAHIRNYVEFYAGVRRPAHLTEERYRAFLATERASGAVESAKKFLAEYALGDES